MKKLVITVRPDGSLETLLKDNVLDTRKFGDRRVKRITLIEHDNTIQKFWILWLVGPYGKHGHNVGICRKIFGQDFAPDKLDHEILQFDDYESAVAHEIECVNALRLKGVSFDDKAAA